MESKCLEPTPGQLVSESFPQTRGKKGQSQVQTVDTEKERTDAEKGELDEALREYQGLISEC